MKKILFFILAVLSLNILAATSSGVPKVFGTDKIEQLPGTKSNLYPNPAKDFIIVKNSSSNKLRNISIVSMVGRSMINKDITDNNNSQEINVTKLSSGRYFVRVSYNDGSQEILTLIKL